MGRVLKAHDVVLDTPVAIKVVRPDLAADRRFRKLFDLEVRIAARFTHPHIVPLHDLGELGDGTPFLGLALADGGSFANLRVDCPPWPDLLALLIELLDALSHLHARDVLHRDLKPENVLLFNGDDGKPHVWLADLGLANASSQLARKKGRVEGTPGFMAPEQKLGLPREYGPWTDLFSAGVIIWEAVTGELPFQHGRSALDSELPALVPRSGLAIPEGLDIVLANLLAAEPLSRYDLAADVRTELEALGPPTVTSQQAREGAGQVRLGTVAPSVAWPSSGSNGPGPSRSTILDTMILDGDVPEPVSVPEFQYGVPVWNRPVPAAMPAECPPEPGFGATARGSLQLFALRELPCVARDGYRQQLWDVAREVAEQRDAKIVLVVGEAGSGKTRLVDSVVHSLVEGGWAEAVEFAYQQPPGPDDGYAGAARALVKPWNESRQTLEARLQRRIARERGVLDDGVREESRMLCRWCGLLDETEEPVAAGYGLREIYRYLEARSWRGLSLLLIDNAQWAAEEGDGLAIADAVQLAAQDGKRDGMLVLATLRSEDLARDAALSAQVAALVDQGAVRIDLPRLGHAETEALLRESLTLTPTLTQILVDRCAGNPLFARTLLVDWANRGWLVDEGGLHFGLAPGVNVDEALPRDAEALFRNQIDGLIAASDNPERFRDVLHMAALAGLGMPTVLLRGLAGADLFAFMRGCGLWVMRGDRMLFDQVLLHRTVRQMAEEREDAGDLHRRLARGFHRYGRKTGIDSSFEIGRHAYHGEDWRLAVPNLLRSARNAWRMGRAKQLEEVSRLAVDACAQGNAPPSRRGWALLWHARFFQMTGDNQAADAHFEQARQACDAAEDDVGVIEALIGMGWAARSAGALPRAEARYSEGMQRARKVEDKKLEAEAIAGLAWVEQQKRNFEGADILFTRVLNRFTQLRDTRGAAEATLGQAFVARRKGQFDEAEELYDEARQGFEEGEDHLGIARAKYGEAVVCRQRLKTDRAMELFREAGGIAEELGAQELLMECRVGRAELLRIEGELDKAQAIYQDHAEWAEREGQFEASIFANLGLAQVAMQRGDVQALYEASQRAVVHLNKVPGHWLWAPYRLMVAMMLAMRRDEEQTYRWIWSAGELGLNDTVDQDIAFVLTRICDIAHEAGWLNVMRVAGKLAVVQWSKLGQPQKVERVTRQLEELASR